MMCSQFPEMFIIDRENSVRVSSLTSQLFIAECSLPHSLPTFCIQLQELMAGIVPSGAWAGGMGGALVDQCQVQTNSFLAQLLTPTLVVVNSGAIMAHRVGCPLHCKVDSANLLSPHLTPQ